MDFNPIFIEDVLTISKEELESCKSVTTKRQKLERNEHIGVVFFFTTLKSSNNTLNVTLNLQYFYKEYDFDANVVFSVQSANYSVKHQDIGYNCYKSGYIDYPGCVKWSANLGTLDEILNSQSNFISNGKLTIHMKAMVLQNATIKQKPCSSLSKISWDCDDKNFVIAVGKEGEPKTEIKVHKHILASQSYVFKRMLETDMKEKAQSRLEIIDFNVEVVQAAVEYFYDRDAFKSLNLENLIDLLLFADKYDINDLKDDLVVPFLFHLYPDTIVNIANASIMTNSATLKDICIKSLNLYINQKVPFDDAEALDQDIEKELKYNSERKKFFHSDFYESFYGNHFY